MRFPVAIEAALRHINREDDSASLQLPGQMSMIAEPFFMGFEAHVGFRPVMNADDLGIGLKKLGG